jgi:hypothetical protein
MKCYPTNKNEGNECERATFDNSTDAGIVAGNCGLVLGIPQRRDNSASILFENNSTWSIPLFSCASANRAVIKTVRFGFNSSNTLAGLDVLSIEPKQYGSASEYPLWAFESIPGSPDATWKLTGWTPLWGIVDKEDTRFTNLTYKRSAELWLSGQTDLSPVDLQDFNLPASEAPKTFLYQAYAVNEQRTNDVSSVADYSGLKNLPLYNLWRNLSQTVEGTERIINLVWTDVATNALVGTRGQFPLSEPPNLARRAEESNSDMQGQVLIYLFNRTTNYNLLYAIPAFIVLAIVIFTLVASVIYLVLGRGTVSRVKFYLSRLSTGRVMTAFLDDDGATETSGKSSGNSTSQWLKKDGRIVVDVSGSVPTTRVRGKRGASKALLEPASKEAKGPLPTQGIRAT